MKNAATPAKRAKPLRAAAKSTPATPAAPPAAKPARFVAKVFRSGNSQAIRIPSGVPLTAKSYTIEFNDNGGVTLIDPAFEARRLKALRSLRGSAPDFPDHTT